MTEALDRHRTSIQTALGRLRAGNVPEHHIQAQLITALGRTGEHLDSERPPGVSEQDFERWQKDRRARIIALQEQLLPKDN